MFDDAIPRDISFGSAPSRVGRQYFGRRFKRRETAKHQQPLGRSLFKDSDGFGAGADRSSLELLRPNGFTAQGRVVFGRVVPSAFYGEGASPSRQCELDNDIHNQLPGENSMIGCASRNKWIPNIRSRRLHRVHRNKWWRWYLEAIRLLQSMKINVVIAVAVILSGCATPPQQQHEIPSTTYRLNPPLDPGKALQVFVEDVRPRVEIEKEPTTDFLYSGSLFSVEGNAKTVAQAIVALVIKFGGTTEACASATNPASGAVIVFRLEHWYSRMARKAEKPPLVVNGQFSGNLILQRDGNEMANRHITANGTPSIVDTYISSEGEKRQTPGLIAKAMEQTANSAEQGGYREIIKYLQETWPRFAEANR